MLVVVTLTDVYRTLLAFGRGANLLLPVPGGEAGPSGVLVCGQNWVAYKHQDHPEVRAPLPRRKDMPPGRDLLVTSGTLHQQPGLFFHLLQSELGDLYKVKALSARLALRLLLPSRFICMLPCENLSKLQLACHLLYQKPACFIRHQIAGFWRYLALL